MRLRNNHVDSHTRSKIKFKIVKQIDCWQQIFCCDYTSIFTYNIKFLSFQIFCLLWLYFGLYAQHSIYQIFCLFWLYFGFYAKHSIYQIFCIRIIITFIVSIKRILSFFSSIKFSSVKIFHHNFSSTKFFLIRIFFSSKIFFSHQNFFSTAHQHDNTSAIYISSEFYLIIIIRNDYISKPNWISLQFTINESRSRHFRNFYFTIYTSIHRSNFIFTNESGQTIQKRNWKNRRENNQNLQKFWRTKWIVMKNIQERFCWLNTRRLKINFIIQHQDFTRYTTQTRCMNTQKN